MSASPSPPNPGQPKRPPTTTTTRRPNFLRRSAPSFLAAGTALTLLWTYFSFRPGPAPNPLRTPGVKNIEGAYRGAGATATHTPAYGGTIQGDRAGERFRGEGRPAAEKTGAPQVQSAGKREFNVSGPNEGEEVGRASRGIGKVQRPAGAQATGVGKLWNRVMYDNEDGK